MPARTVVAAALPSPASRTAGLLSLNAILSWARNEISYLAGNRKPAASPYLLPQTGEDSTAVNPVVLGAMNSTGPNGNPVSFTVVGAPVNGVVDLAPDGSFVYSPDSGFAGKDTFSVRVTDAGWHLTRLLGIANRSIVVPVSVTVEAPGLQSTTTYAYTIYNLTQHPQQLVGFNTASNGTKYLPVTGPPIGSVIQPGLSAQFVVNPGTDVIPQYGRSDIPVGVPVQAQYFAFLNTFSSVQQVGCANYTGACSPSSSSNLVKSNQLLFMDAPGTVVTVPADQAQQQSDILDSLCGGLGTCSFESDGKQPIIGFGNAHLPTGFSPVVNNTASSSVSTSISITDTTATAQSWSVSVGAKASNLTKTVEVSLTATYGQTITETHTFTQTITTSVPPYSEVFIFGATPVYRYYGNWQILAGNTTWILQNVWFDTPNPAGNPIYVIDNCAVGSQECLNYTTGVAVNTTGLPPSLNDTLSASGPPPTFPTV